MLPLNSGEAQCFQASFHSIITLRVFDYAPPDTVGIKFAASCLRTTAVNRTCSRNFDRPCLLAGHQGSPCRGAVSRRLTEGLYQISRDLSVSASPSHLPFQGRLWTVCGLFYPAEACFFPDLFLAARPARLMQAARVATRAQPTRPETEVPAALSLPAKL